MKGDFTRFTFDSTKHLSGLLKQQGRVDLDADWNELIDILAHRLNQQTIDTIGATGIPRPPGLNPPLPFQVSADTTGAISLTPGKIYIDGLLCEHESGPLNNGYFQPPMPTVSLAGLVNGANLGALIYLDVWKRHVSFLEDPGLLEKALYGPDTTTRIQTAWQLHAIPNPAHPGDCTRATDLPVPSEGLLSWKSIQSTDPTPCAVGGQGGFTGLENRLYRVEIHDPVALNFKWSRDNNSVGLPIQSVVTGNANQLQVDQLSVSDFERYYHHWVELLSDEVEYKDGRGLLAQVTGVDVINGIITLDQPANAFVNITNTHLRIRRWDMAYAAGGAPPLCQVGTGNWLDLEDNVQVKFDRATAGPMAPNFLSGDYWTFTARAVDSLVEEKDNQPPQGIRHHYSKLGFLNWAKDAGGTITVKSTQCVPTFPSLTDLPGAGKCNCCVEIDGRQDVLQQLNAAVAQLTQAGGGQILLPPGVHELKGTVTIGGPNISIEGCAGQTAIVYTPPQGSTAPAFVIDGQPATGVRLSGFSLYASGTGPLVYVGNALDTRIEKCRLVNLPSGASWTEAIEATPTTVGLSIWDCDLASDVALIELNDGEAGGGRSSDISIERCRIIARLVGLWMESGTWLAIRDTKLWGVTQATWVQLVAFGPNLITATALLDQALDPLLEPVPTNDDVTIATSSAVPAAIGAVRSAAIALGGLLPIGVALIGAISVDLSNCHIHAAVSIWGSWMQDVRVSRCTLAGMFGIVVQNSTELRVTNCKIAAWLEGIAAGGYFWTWHVSENVIIGRVGILFTSAWAARFRLLETLTFVQNGLQKPIPEWSPWTHGQQFDAGPAGYAGGTALYNMLSVREGIALLGTSTGSHVERCTIRANMIGGEDTGLFIEDRFSVSEVGQVEVVDNHIVGGRATAINLQGRYPQGDSAIRGNQIEVACAGIRVALAGTLVHGNQVSVRGRITNMPMNQASLNELGAAVGYTNAFLDYTYPPNVRRLLDRTVQTFAAVGGPPAPVTPALTHLVEQVLINMPYETDLVNFCVAMIAKLDLVSAVAAIAAFEDVFMGALDGVGISAESAFVAVVDNFVHGLSGRAGMVLDAAPATLGNTFATFAPGGPGAALMQGTFTAIQQSPATTLRSTAIDTGLLPGLTLQVTASTEVDFARNRIYGGLGHGIDIRRATSRVRMIDNIIDAMSGSGVNLDLGVTLDLLEIRGNRITECVADSLGLFPGVTLGGIVVYGSNEAIIATNVIDSNGGPVTTAIAAISCLTCSNVVIQSNTVTNNSSPDPAGNGSAIWLGSSGYASITDNVLLDNGNNGIFVTSTSSVLIDGNQATSSSHGDGNWVAGFLVVIANMLTLTNNQIDYGLSWPPALVLSGFFSITTVTKAVLMGNKVTGNNALPLNSWWPVPNVQWIVVGNLNTSASSWQVISAGGTIVSVNNIP